MLIPCCKYVETTFIDEWTAVNSRFTFQSDVSVVDNNNKRQSYTQHDPRKLDGNPQD